MQDTFRRTSGSGCKGLAEKADCLDAWQLRRIVEDRPRVLDAYMWWQFVRAEFTEVILTWPIKMTKIGLDACLLFAFHSLDN